jgi:peptidoglycan/LPS O-acetylase OafA/YrhL
VFIKYDLRLPVWTGDEPPNQWGTPEGRIWSWKYALIITVASIAVAALITYLYEKPMADLINGKKKKAAKQLGK